MTGERMDDKVAEYLADMPNSAMGMLTFYNAVANGGRMVKLVTEEGETIVCDAVTMFAIGKVTTEH